MAAAAAAGPQESTAPPWLDWHEITLLRAVLNHQAAEGLTRADMMVGIVPLLNGLVAEGGALHGFTSDACLDKLYQLRDRYRADLTQDGLVHALASRVWLEQPLLPETMAAQKAAELSRLADQVTTSDERITAIRLQMTSLIESLDETHILEPQVRAGLRHELALAMNQSEAVTQVLSDLRDSLPSGPHSGGSSQDQPEASL